MDFLEDKAEEAEESGDFQTAFRLWNELAVRNRDPVFFCNSARAAEKLELWKWAEEAFYAALRLEPKFPLAMEGMGSLWLTRTDVEDSESLRTAKTWFQKALEYGANARVLTFLGVTCIALGTQEEAEAAFEQALQMDPTYSEALYNLAKLKKDIDRDKAISLLEQAVDLDPDYPLAHQELGKLYQKSGDLTRAEYHFRQSLEADPTDYWAHLFLANLLAVQGKHSEAEQTYRFAVTLHPEIKSGTKIFANFLDSIGKFEEAALVRVQANSRTGTV